MQETLKERPSSSNQIDDLNFQEQGNPISIESDPLNDLINNPEAQKTIERAQELADVTHSSERDFKGVRNEFGGDPVGSLNAERDLIRLKGMGPPPALSHEANEIAKLQSQVEIESKLDELNEIEVAAAELELDKPDITPQDKEAMVLEVESKLNKLEQKHDFSAKAVNSINVDRKNREFEAKVEQVKEDLTELKTQPEETKEEKGGFFSSAWGFVKGISDDIGLTDLVKGAGSLAKGTAELLTVAPRAAMDLYKVAKGEMTGAEFVERTTGNIKEAVSDLKDGGKAIVGAVKLAGEITGISDAVRCVGCAMKGDWKGAAMHGAFALMSAGSIVATVATVGAAGGTVLGVMGLKTAAQTGLKVAVKEGFEVAAKELGERAVQKLSIEVLEAAGEKAAKQTVKELGQELGQLTAKELAQMTPEIAQQLSKQVAEQNVQKVVSEITEKVVKDVGGDWAKMAVKSPDKFVKEMTELGIDKTSAKKMQSLIAKGGADKEIQKIMCEGMQEPLEKRFREGMTKSFEKNLDEGIEKLKGKYNLGDDVADGMKKGGREGLESGIQKGVKEGLEQGWKKVFDELRRKKWDLDFKTSSDKGLSFNTNKTAQGLYEGSAAKGISAENTKFAQTGKGTRIRGASSAPSDNGPAYELGSENKAA